MIKWKKFRKGMKLGKGTYLFCRCVEVGKKDRYYYYDIYSITNEESAIPSIETISFYQEITDPE